MINLPPGASSASASRTHSPTGVKSIARFSFAGGVCPERPVHAAPRDSAKLACSCVFVKTKTGLFGNLCFIICCLL